MVAGKDKTAHRFTVRNNRWVESTAGAEPILDQNRLALPLLSGIRYFAPMYRALTSLFFYTPATDALRALQPPDEGRSLARDGTNAVSVLQRLQTTDSPLYGKVAQALSLIVPTIRTLGTKSYGPLLTISFEEALENGRQITLEARDMSEGTLRALGLFLAAYQADPATLVCLEEPETAIHPGVMEVLPEILDEAALRTQILVTTHSPDFIMFTKIGRLRAVARVNGQTVIAPIDTRQRGIIEDGLFDLGELHRIEGLQPAPELIEQIQSRA